MEKNHTYGYLKPIWYWNQKSGEKVWKCVCINCGGICYVKERALIKCLVTNCGCITEGGLSRFK